MSFEPECVEDCRSAMERWAWKMIGPPLYYCEHCLVGVDVRAAEGQAPVIERHCDHHGANIIAPRRSILAGEGGLSVPNKIRMGLAKLKSSLTGRT